MIHKNYLLFLIKKKILYITILFLLLLASVFYYSISLDKKINHRIYLLTVKINNQELFLSKEFVKWSKDTISKVYFNNNFELSSVDDLDKFNTLNHNLKIILFNNLKKEVIKNFDIENISSLEISVIKDDKFDHYVEILDAEVSSQDLFVSYEEYLIDLLNSFLISFNNDQNLNLKKLAQQFLSISIFEKSKYNSHDIIVLLISPFLLTFLISLVGFYNEQLKKND